MLSFLLAAHTEGLTPCLPHALCHDGVLLCSAGEEAQVSGLAAPVDLLGILQTALTGDQALNEAPPLVIVALANIYVEGDAEYWVDACIK